MEAASTATVEAAPTAAVEAATAAAKATASRGDARGKHADRGSCE
jgi:hypothetical protein